VVKKDPLITYESVILDQAGSENVSGSTVSFERKLMSTKTSIKRIAAVAAVALTLGGFSAVSAQAAVTSGGLIVDYSYAASDSPAKPGILINSVAATNKDILVIRDQFRATTDLAQDVVSITTIQDVVGSDGLLNPTYPYFDAADGNIAAMDTYSGLHNASTAVGADTTKLTVTATVAGTAVGQHVIKFRPTLPGTYKFLISSTAGASYTWTVTAVAPTYDHSVATLTAGTGTVSGSTSGSTITAAAAANTGAFASVAVTQWTTAGEVVAATSANSKAVVVAISKGLVGLSTGSYATSTPSVTVAAGGTGSNTFNVYSNGSVGNATLTVTVNGTLLATYPVVLKGTATAMTVAGSVWIAPAANLTLTVGANDSAGNAAVSVPAYTCTSSNTAVATVTAGGVVTGVAAGDASITCADNASVATSAVTKVHVAPAVATGLPTLTFDKDTYAPGELMTITISAEAADNGSFALFTGTPVANATYASVSGAPAGGVVALASGTATWKAYAPVTAGDFIISATTGTGVNGGTAAAFSAKATIVNASLDAAQAAIDAAQEATDAANAAYDAANNAMDSADAATAAAQDASDNASAALAAVTDLAATVAKLVASVNAIASALAKLQAVQAKIQKKLKA